MTDRSFGDTDWRRLHPLSPVVRLGKSFVPVFFIIFSIFASGGRDKGSLGGLLVHFGIIIVLIPIGVIVWAVTRWRVQDGTLRIEMGLLKRSSLRFPLSQIQAIDIVQPALGRIFGLSELRLRMAGSTSKSGRLAYLHTSEAEALRARLLAMSQGLSHDTPAPQEDVIVELPTRRLLLAMLITWEGFVALVALIAFVVTAIIAPHVLGVLIASYTGLIIAFFYRWWRRFNSDYRMTVAQAPDGLRLRSGLVQRTAETVRTGRVQAIRIEEPLLWRLFGWCRLKVDVAGMQRGKGEGSNEARSLRVALPVGTKEEASKVLELLMPDLPAPDKRPPSRAWFKSPLRFHFLAWGRNDKVVVTSGGRLTRHTAWVPFEKVQSIRRNEGPVQRKLKLVTIHFDTAGRSVHASLRDRDWNEVAQQLPMLVDRCRAARKTVPIGKKV